jgi:hypothetical protein
MANMMIGLVALALSSQTLPISYAEEMSPGMDINISHGTYICPAKPVNGALERLIDIADHSNRRKVATTLGCDFTLDDNTDHIFKITKVVKSLCLDREIHPGGMMLSDGSVYEGNIISCGREGHEVVINPAPGIERHVIVLSLDIDYD